MKKFCVLLLLCSTVYSYAQKVAKPDAFAKTIKAADLKKHLYIVASPEMEGRETGTEGQHKAAAYIESYFKQLRLQPGNGNDYQLYYNLNQDTLLGAAIAVNGKPFELDKDFSAINFNAPPVLQFHDVVITGTNATDNLKNTDLRDKLLIVVGRVNRNFFSQLSTKMPAVAMFVSNEFPTTSNRLGRQYMQDSRRISPLQLNISENLAKAIAGPAYDAVKADAALLQTANTDVVLDIKKQTRSLQASDVIGILPGTDLKDQYVFVSAHYDHLGKRGNVIFFGADDDGSGTVSLLEMAEAFTRAKQKGKGPRRSIVFLANSGEEKGLLGSEYFTDHPTVPLEKTTVDLNIDMIGRIDPDRKQGDSTNYVYVVGDDKISSDLKPISEEQNNKYVKMELDYKYNDPKDPERIYYRSDHYNFAKHGVPIIFYYDGMLRPDYHRPTDTPDKINYKLMQKRARLVFYTAWEMANRNEMLKRDIPLAPAGF